ncbi:hypothetical protein GCM10020358_47940 [Amorphoplanes nipponensis]|uniref:Uncharacterized protein n=2 Tax=Actinoplanes nipponensis TaxID=135950 RepID=A0A919JH11_9ACTN|nr:hypothetical protein Ani05nite_30270 [Actinoplanes nipponensis]
MRRESLPNADSAVGTTVTTRSGGGALAAAWRRGDAVAVAADGGDAVAVASIAARRRYSPLGGTTAVAAQEGMPG